MEEYSIHNSEKEITKVIVILHAYQPPTQEEKILDRIVKNCYLPVISSLLENSNFKITLNINASLVELLEPKYPNIIEELITLAENKQLEFLETGAYHPILPLLSEKEAKLQIEMNNRINSGVFGKVWMPKGFWPPELAVSKALATLVESLGYHYMVVPEISVSSNTPFPIPLLTRVSVYPNAPHLSLINRNHEISNNISFKKYPSIDNLKEHIKMLKISQPEGVVVIATDLETFGEHHLNYDKFLVKILQSFDSCTASTLLTMPKQPIVQFRESSWSTSEEDLYRNIPYPLWSYPGNSIHDLLNIHQDLLSNAIALLLAKKDENDYDVKIALKEHAKAQYSCVSWWASTKDHFSKKMIVEGFHSQKKALKKILEALNGHLIEESVLLKFSNDIGRRIEQYLSRIR
ncbi:hypothetical protein [Candidatus Hodarchaeum mangrovi]